MSLAALKKQSDFSSLIDEYNKQTTPQQHTGGTRGLFFGGRTPSDVDTIDFVNIDTTGNAIDFGNRLESSRQACGTPS